MSNASQFNRRMQIYPENNAAFQQSQPSNQNHPPPPQFDDAAFSQNGTKLSRREYVTVLERWAISKDFVPSRQIRKTAVIKYFIMLSQKLTTPRHTEPNNKKIYK